MEDMATTASELQSLDVLVVGAGISGIGAAYYLQRDHPQRSYAILEARNASGGTWSSGDGRWTVTTEDADTGERSTLTCQWLLSASGYYRYDGGFTPYFEGRERFGGRVVHPQNWPEDLDYEGKRVIVIGSGATAVTLVPAMAGQAGQPRPVADLPDLQRRRQAAAPGVRRRPGASVRAGYRPCALSLASRRG